MPNPRNRHSRMRKRQRRTHDNLALPTLSTCQTTGEVHLRHHAYQHEGNTYYKGVMVAKGKAKAETTKDSSDEE
jgi:large subunit ribosomal protein L32